MVSSICVRSLMAIGCEMKKALVLSKYDNNNPRTSTRTTLVALGNQFPIPGPKRAEHNHAKYTTTVTGNENLKC